MANRRRSVSRSARRRSATTQNTQEKAKDAVKNESSTKGKYEFLVLPLLALVLLAALCAVYVSESSFQVKTSIVVLASAVGIWIFLKSSGMFISRSSCFDRSAVDALKKQLEENIRRRQTAKNRNETYKFRGISRCNSDTSLLNKITGGLFIDKTKSYRTILETLDNLPLGVRFTSYPRLTGRTTWLSFLKLSLGPLWNTSLEERESFYNAVADMEEGKWFLEAPLRPIITVNMLNVDSGRSLLDHIKEEFEAYGVRVASTIGFDSYISHATTNLKQLYVQAIEELAQAKPQLNVTEEVSSDVLLLMDDYDLPFREFENGSAKSWFWNFLDTFIPASPSSKRQRSEELVQKLSILCSCVKRLIAQDTVWGMCVVSLIPLGRTGKSKLKDTPVLTFQQKYHELFGISERELSTALCEHASETMSLRRVLRWASQTEVSIILSPERDQFFEWLSESLNTFCRALDSEGSSLTPVYSPLDVLKLLEHVENNNKSIPELEWLKQSRKIWVNLLRGKLRQGDLRDATLGGGVRRKTFEQTQHFSDLFPPCTFRRSFSLSSYNVLENPNRETHCALLFYLGMLQARVSSATSVMVTRSENFDTFKCFDALIKDI